MRGFPLLAIGIALLLTPCGRVAATSASSAAPEAPKTGVMGATVRLVTDRTTFAAGEPVTVHVILANSGRHRVALLRWLTPLDGVDGPLFAVTHDGAPVRYLGRMVKRAAPTDADYVTLEPGASVTADVDLAQLYALATPGRYEVAYDVTSPQLVLPGRNAPPTDGQLTSAPLAITIEAAAARS